MNKAPPLFHLFRVSRGVLEDFCFVFGVKVGASAGVCRGWSTSSTLVGTSTGVARDLTHGVFACGPDLLNLEQ